MFIDAGLRRACAVLGSSSPTANPESPLAEARSSVMWGAGGLSATRGEGRFVGRRVLPGRVVNSYARELALWWQYLQSFELAWDGLTLADVGGFLTWLRSYDGPMSPQSSRGPLGSPSRVDDLGSAQGGDVLLQPPPAVDRQAA
jgi:hypothetical protein